MNTSSPFSFHCIVCFEEFDTDTRAPVVLPCGHTYICAQCAERLDKCVECRTSLYQQMIETPKENSRSTASSRNSRAYTPRYQGRPRTPGTYVWPDEPLVVKTRLPLPKNVVLLSLMEATEMASESVERFQNSSNVSDFVSKGSNLDDSNHLKSGEDDEQERIRKGTLATVGSSGTYAIKSSNGLHILNEKKIPNAIPLKRTVSNPWEVTVDKIVSASISGANVHPTDITLGYGDRIQVVAVEDNWAKLARGYGYIHLTDTADIVKVGGCIDKACSIEAVIHSLSKLRIDLKREQARVETEALAYMEQLKDVLLHSDDLTVIGAETFDETIVEEEKRDCYSTQEEKVEEKKIEVKITQTVIRESTTTPNNPTRPSSNAQNTSWFNYIFRNSYNPNNMSETPRRTRSDPYSYSHDIDVSSLSAGARAWRERNGREAVHTIHFKTGLSGHLAVQSHNAHPNVLMERRDRFVKMSCHGGLTLPKGRHRVGSISN